MNECWRGAPSAETRSHSLSCLQLWCSYKATQLHPKWLRERKKNFLWRFKAQKVSHWIWCFEKLKKSRAVVILFFYIFLHTHTHTHISFKNLIYNIFIIIIIIKNYCSYFSHASSLIGLWEVYRRGCLPLVHHPDHVPGLYQVSLLKRNRMMILQQCASVHKAVRFINYMSNVILESHLHQAVMHCITVQTKSSWLTTWQTSAMSKVMVLQH